MKKIFITALMAMMAFGAHADEGMWMLNNIDSKTAGVMKQLGLQLTPQELYNPEGVSLKDAVVDFGDFCSGVVVSKDGLVFTNHHCGYGAIQALSTPEDDILKDGFVAHSFGEERPARDLFVRFLDRTEDCTERVLSAIDSIAKANPKTPLKEIYRAELDGVMKNVEKEYSDANPDMYCLVKSFYGNSRFYASIYKVYNDIRLVFTPTETLGKFGGDADNWMWPRQTSDFSVFRIYADSLGNPADYSPENVPLHPKRYAKVCMDGIQDGEYCMTIGYPGSTSRYLSSYGIQQRMQAQNMAMIEVRGAKQDVWKKWMDSDRVIALKYASKWASSSNYWKNSIGMNKALAELDVVGEKQKLEARLTEWFSADKALKARFGKMLPELKKAYKACFNASFAYNYFNETFMRGIEIRRATSTLQRLPQDADSTDLASARESMETFYKDYDARLDEDAMAALLQFYREKVDKKFLPEFYKTIDKEYKGDCKAYAHSIYANTIMTKPNSLDLLMADSTLRDTDPAFVYADQVLDMQSSLLAQLKKNSATIRYNENLLTQAVLEQDIDNPHYSDANFTMRLSYGFINGYNDYPFFTPSQSLLDKAAKQKEIEDYVLEQDIVDFMARRDWGRYADKKDGDLHLCFLSNNDITGGNSGSPMFNGKGELIGLAFDGNWEAMSGDISFDTTLQRCIGVDIRFVLFLIDKWGHADNLIQELEL